MYIEIKPSNSLKDYVESYWIRSGVTEDCTTIVEPDGCFDIVIYFFEKNKIILTGIWEEPIKVNSYKNVDILGVRFYPSSLDMFFKYRIADIKNAIIEVEEICFKNDIDIQLLKETKNIDEIITFFDIILESMLKDNSKNLISKMLEEIKNSSDIENISKNIGVSRRHLAREMKQKLGITTKSYVNIVRFIKAKEMLINKKTISDIVYECGYYDQPHFIKEFKKYTGKTPTEY